MSHFLVGAVCQFCHTLIVTRFSFYDLFHYRDVHVLEFLSSGFTEDSPGFDAAATPKRLTVALEIQPRGRTAVRKHILLVLKSNVPTLWKVRTRGLRGTLGFIVSLLITWSFVEGF